MAQNRLFSPMLVAALSTALLTGCSSSTAPVDTRKAEEAAISAASDAMGQAFATRDLDKSMSFYLDDAVLFVPNSPAVIGKDAIRKAFEQFLSVPALKLATSDTIIDVAASGDLAFERGSYANTITDAKGKTSTQTGKLVLVWKKQTDGSWKVAADTNASDK